MGRLAEPGDGSRPAVGMAQPAEDGNDFADLVARIPVGIYKLQLGPDGSKGFHYLSPKLCEITGLDAQAVLADAAVAFAACHPEDLPGLLEATAAAARTLHPFAWEGRYLVRGAVRWLRIEADATALPAGASQWTGVVSDISERRQSEIALQRSLAELEQFASVASHDLRQPLRMVSSYLKLIERSLRDRLGKDERDFLAFAIDGAQRMDRMILDLLDYSRLGRQADGTGPVALPAAVDEALLNLAPAIREAGGTISIAAGLPVVVGDYGELVRLFQNLIGNAVAYRAPDRPPLVEIACHRRGAEWTVSVKDNGIGIDPADHERAFRVFQRLAGRQQAEGSGIGLAICKKIVEHHGGRIWIDSAIGEGSTFLFTLPVGDGRT